MDEDEDEGEREGEGEGSVSDDGRRRGRRKGWRIAWRQRDSLLMPGWLLRSERVQEFVEAGDGAETEYRCWETFYGLLAPVVRMAVGRQVAAGFDAWTEGLKRRAEEKKKEEEAEEEEDEAGRVLGPS